MYTRYSYNYIIDLWKCCICGNPRPSGLTYCLKCYKQYIESIKNPPSWLRMLKTTQQKENRRAIRERDVLSLDALASSALSHGGM